MKKCCKQAVKIYKQLLRMADTEATAVDQEKKEKLQEQLARLQKKKCCRTALKKLLDKQQRKTEERAAEGADEKKLGRELPERTLTRLAKLIREELKKHERSEDLEQAMWWFEQANAAMSGRSTDLFPAVDEMLAAGLEAIARLQAMKPDSGS